MARDDITLWMDVEASESRAIISSRRQNKGWRTDTSTWLLLAVPHRYKRGFKERSTMKRNGPKASDLLFYVFFGDTEGISYIYPFPSNAASCALAHPPLHRLSAFPNRLLAPTANLLSPQLNLFPTFNRRSSNPHMILRDQRSSFLVRPHQIRDIPCREGEYNPCCSHADRKRYGGPEEDIPVPRQDGAGHGGNEHVECSRHDPLVGLAWRGERGDGGGEGAFLGEDRGHEIVEG